MTTDPAVHAVAEALWKDADYDGDDTWANGDPMPEQYQRRAQVAVDAYRRAVRDSRPDAERWAALRADAEYAVGVHPGREVGIPAQEALGLLAALADAEAARQAAEADRDLLVRVRDEAVGKTADYAEVIRRVRDRLDALAEGELAHRSRDYGRGVAQAVREIRAVLDGAVDPAVDEEET